MAAKTNQVAVEIVAIDEASPKIDKLTKKIEGLESDEARIIVTSNIDRLDQQLTDALAKLHNLDGDEATVQARLVGNLEQDLIDAKKLFDQLDGQTGTVTLDASGATQQIDELGKSAGSSKSALANMIGNTTQDLGALGGVAGSAGVAIGQLGEYAADAALDGERLGSALGSMLKVAGPIAALALTVKAITDAVQSQAELNELAADRQERWNDALEEGTDAGDNWVEALGKIHELTVDITKLPELGPEFTQQGVSFKSFFNILDSGRKTTADATEAFKNAGIATSDLADAVTGGADAYEQFVAGVEAARAAGRISKDEATLIIGLLDQETEAYKDAREARRQFQRVFDPKPAVDEANVLAAVNTQLERYLELLEGQHRQGSLDQQAASQAAANEQLERYLDLLLQRHGEAEDQRLLNQQYDVAIDKLAALNMERERVDAQGLVNQEAEAVRDLDDAWSDLFGELDAESQRLRLVKAFEDARERLAAGNLTLVDAGLLLNDLKERAARYAEQLGNVPPEVTTKILADIDTLGLDQAEAVLLGLVPPTPITIPVVPQWAQSSVPNFPSFIRPPSATAAATPTVNQTVILPPGSPAMTFDQFSIFVERNGERTQL